MAPANIFCRPAIIGAIVVLLGGSIAEILANDWQSWLGAAVLVRCGVGLAQSILITYVSELAPFQIRGFMIGAYQLFIAFGQLISAVATQLVTVHQPNKWRPLIATEFIFTGYSPSWRTWTDPHPNHWVRSQVSLLARTKGAT
jgi:MFS transporter, SP family, general alpha glucoside:H+ symporter